MRFIQMPNKKIRTNSGFTLIEMLVVAPVAILAVGTLIAVMVAMVGDVLVSRDRNVMSYEIQNGLDQIEQDTRLSTQFLVTSKTLPSPQGKDNNFKGTAAFTSTDSLVLGVLATDKNPVDSTRQLIYYAKQPNDCGDQQTFNRLFITKVIYFIKDGSLWRRSVVPPYNTNSTPDDNTVCSTPWQMNTCVDGLGGGGSCKTKDTELVKNVSSFNVKYYTTPASTTNLGASGALSASTIEVTINGQKTIAGENVTTSGSIRATKLNSIDVELPPPTTPSVSYRLTAPAQVTFSWNTVPSATSYVVSYNINGGSWVNVAGGVTSTSYVVNASRNDTVTIRVAAKNATGTSPNAQVAATIPAWTTCDLQNSWSNYGSVYPDASFTKSTAGVVMLHGLIKGGTGAAGEVICTLPPEYRPDYNLIFQVATSGTTVGRIDVNTNGDVIFRTGSTAWINLDTIAFIPSGAYTWTGGLTGYNGWIYYGSVYSPIKVTKDSLGRAHIEGLAKGGTTTNITNAFALPGGYGVDDNDIYPASSGRFNAMDLSSVAYIRTRGIPYNGYWSLQSMWWPNTAATGWNTPALQSGWVRYATSYSTAQYKKGADGIVSLRGLVKSGTITSGTPIITLPAGYRPNENIICDATGYDATESTGYARIDVTSTGAVVTREGVNASFLSLAGCDFMAEQ